MYNVGCMVEYMNYTPRTLEEILNNRNLGRGLKMNIVQARLAKDKNAKRYTYQVPDDIQLFKGDVVRTKNINGKECIAICETDSEFLSDNAINMIMCGNRVASSIIGIYTLDLFSDNSSVEL